MTETSWVERIDLAFVDGRFGRAQVDKLLADPLAYAEEPPRLDDAGRLLATLAGPAGALRVQLRVQPTTGAIEVACACSRGRAAVCDHVVRVLVDLAIHPGLRTALARGEPSVDRVAELPARRSEAHAEHTLELGLARWLPASGETVDLEIDVAAVRFTGIPSPDARPAILVRCRSPPSPRLLNPKDVLAARLSERHRRLVELTAPGQLQRDALVASRATASLLVHLLRDELHAKTGGFKRPLRFSREEVAPRVDRERDALVVRWHTAAGRRVCDAADALLFTGPFPYLWSEAQEVFHPVAPDVDLAAAWAFHSVPHLVLPERAATRVGRLLLGRARASGVTLPAPEAFGLARQETPSFVLVLAGWPLDVRAQLSAVYESGAVALGRAAAAPGVGRDIEGEARALARVGESGLAEDEDGSMRVAGERAADFWQRGLAVVRNGDAPPIEVRLDESLARVRIGPPAEVRVDVGTASGWLETQLQFTAGAIAVEIAALRAAVAEKRRWVALSDATLTRITDELADLVDETAGLVDDTGRSRLPTREIGRVAHWVERYGGAMSEPMSRWRDRLRGLALAPPSIPAGLRASLRPYQCDGLAWLQFLRELGTGGVLADDMGLGKTLMTLALLARLKEDDGPRPSLVVCPTSVVGNWRREAERFVPDLRIVVLEGTGDDLAALDHYDLAIASYGFLRRRIDRLASRRFRCAVLDEAQNIKNASAATSRAARRLDAEMRLALSGTPVENRIHELWSLMTFANPGLLGDEADFDERYERPIAARPDGAAAERLRAIVRPFLLRRTKAEVLTDLPPKTEIDRACVFGMRQRRLYDALAFTLREAVKKDIQKRGLARSQLSVLTAILRLRQMACDPRLVDPAVPAAESAKRAAFLDLVRELFSEQRRALVFSQFVELLKLWREDLDRERIAYEYLDGASTDRAAIVDRFQNGTAPLFLLSLKAGGAGLNLTAADTVIHCDPWWNPAVEDQATDRAHRIGQMRPVTVVRLVASGTIEDKIGRLKDKKRQIAASVIEGAPGALHGLGKADIGVLLGDIDGESDRDESGDDDGDAQDPPAAPGFLRAHEVDEMRAILRWLEQTGVTRKDLARQVGMARSPLALLLIGHRVPMATDVAERIRKMGASRGRGHGR